VVIEHNLDIIKSADWVIDLGPEGGVGGGKVVGTGTPEQLARNPHSYTAKYLTRALKNGTNGHQDAANRKAALVRSREAGKTRQPARSGPTSK
jgi:hypothetical protein